MPYTIEIPNKRTGKTYTEVIEDKDLKGIIYVLEVSLASGTSATITNSDGYCKHISGTYKTPHKTILYRVLQHMGIINGSFII